MGVGQGEMEYDIIVNDKFNILLYRKLKIVTD